MKAFNPYNIEFTGLKDGLHHYEFVLDDAFFDGFTREDFEHSHIEIMVDMQKDDSMLVFHIKFDGKVSMSCDRCLQSYNQGLQGNKHLVVRLDGDTEANPSEDEDLLVLGSNEIAFDLAPYLNDLMQVSLPWTRRCSQDLGGEKQCDPEMLQRIAKYQPKTEEKEPENDPRWDALKKLKHNS